MLSRTGDEGGQDMAFFFECLGLGAGIVVSVANLCKAIAKHNKPKNK